MEKSNKRKTPKILLGVSIIILIISVVLGLYSAVMLKHELNINPDMMDDSYGLITILGFAAHVFVPVMMFLMILVYVGLALLVIAVMWGIYGIILLLNKKKGKNMWKVLIIVGTIIIFVILAILIVIIANRKPKLEENTIGSIAYDYNDSLGYTVYIEENGEYVPYLVLTYDYNKTGNALCLRKNVIGGKNGYSMEYNGMIAKERVYDGWLEMNSYYEYEETAVDKYLNNEFINKIDQNLLNKICDTNLSFSEYLNGVYTNYEINRKFFLLSLTEIGDKSGFDNKSKNKMVLKYFTSGDMRIANNDAGVESPWWTRTSKYTYCAIGYTGGTITQTGTNAKYGVRPAFTIPNTTKIKQINDRGINHSIYVFE